MSYSVVLPAVASEIAAGDDLKLIDLAREKKIDPSCTFRWSSKGLPAADGNRVRLEAIRIGRAWHTSRAAVRRFFAALPQSTNEPSTSSIARPRSADKRMNDDAHAAARLREKGF